jgi:aerobic-type carbon monoxide dehydrogenase small subunit (CoxS/CutS family)
MLAPQARDRHVMTIEGLGTPERLHPLQQAFVDHFAAQCGYCTPSMILTAKALLDEQPDAQEEDIRHTLHGTICRCTGYVKIVQAIEAARDAMA